MQGDEFDERLEAARKRAGLEPSGSAPTGPAGLASRDGAHPLTFAARLGAEMVGSLLVACAIGWGLDRLLGTRPWLMIGFLPIGVAAGVMNLLRASRPGGTRGGPPRGKGWGT